MMMLGTEPKAESLARKTSPEDRLEWEQVMVGFETGFSNSLPKWTGGVAVRHEEPLPGEILLTVAPVYMRLGKFTFMYDETTELALRCLWSRDGVRLEPSAVHPTAAMRVEYAAKLLARICGDYVKKAG